MKLVVLANPKPNCQRSPFFLVRYTTQSDPISELTKRLDHEPEEKNIQLVLPDPRFSGTATYGAAPHRQTRFCTFLQKI
jgi:hypothetical protein